MAIINVPEVLRKKLNEDGTDAFVGILNQVEQSAKENSIGIVSERFERRLSEEIAKVDKRISDEGNRLDKRISDEVTRLDKRISDEANRLDKRITDEMADLKCRISDSHVGIVRWLFVLWTAQMAATAGLFLHIK